MKNKVYILEILLFAALIVAPAAGDDSDQDRERDQFSEILSECTKKEVSANYCSLNNKLNVFGSAPKLSCRT